MLLVVLQACAGSFKKVMQVNNFFDLEEFIQCKLETEAPKILLPLVKSTSACYKDLKRELTVFVSADVISLGFVKWNVSH